MPVGPGGEPLPYPGDTTGFPPTINVGGQPDDPAAAAGGSFDDRVAQIRADVLALIEENGVTEVERLEFEKITTALQKLKAARAKEDQAALGGGPATNAVRRILGG